MAPRRERRPDAELEHWPDREQRVTVPGAADRDSGEGTPAEAPLAVQHRRVARASGDFVPAARLLPFLALTAREAETLRRSLLPAREYLAAPDAGTVGALAQRLRPFLPSPDETPAESVGGAIQSNGDIGASSGLLAAGELRVGPVVLPILGINVLPAPVLTATTAFTCLSPLVAALPLPDGRTRYLRPCDGDAFSEAVRRNLLRKHRLLHGAPPADDRLALAFDPAYLARSGGGTKLVTYKDIKIVGAFSPFTLAGSTELMETGYQAGLGEKNAGGFGMVEVTKR